MPAHSLLLAGALAAAVTAAVAVLLLLRRYLEGRRRLRLRLVTGRRVLLEQEAAQVMAELSQLEGQEPSPRAMADDALNRLHAALLERQAHLENCEDLAHLQRQKMAVLARRLDDVAEGADDAGEVETPSPQERGESQGQRRERMQEDLLRKIGEIQRRQTGPHPQN
ncbi:MAG: hypothetical protein ABIL09_25965 [Gemmatimonadota bacterium]